jgi:anaerobic magnesium-protoporphyrin IX monomethyl ester cyclase
MKIVLIAPPYPLAEAPSPPLGLCYAAAACEAAGAQVTILDYIVGRYTPQKLKAALDELRPDAVGTNSVSMNFHQAIGIIQEVKRIQPDIITLMGGPHVSFTVADTLGRYPELDLIVIGEGEETLLELVPVIRSRPLWHKVAGMAFRNGSELVITPPRPLIADLDGLPPPSRHLLPLSRYQALGFPVSLVTSRGCPNRCIFCLGRHMVGPTPRYRSVQAVVDEMEGLVADGFDRINVADDLFAANKKRVQALCAEIQRRGVRCAWSAFARVNTVDLEMLCAMKAAGCDSVSFGIESGNSQLLRRVKKGITLEQARKAVALSKQAGLRTHASFMVGLPGESPETLAQTRRFAEALDIEHGYHFLSPFPGTTLRQEIERYDLQILTDDWRLYDANQAIVRTSRLSAKEMDDFVDAIYQGHKARTDAMEMRYRQGNCSEAEFLMIEGYSRMTLIHRLLAEDLIDDLPNLPANGSDPAARLIEHLARITKMELPLVDRTLKSLITTGHLRCQAGRRGWKWSWAPNRPVRSDPPAARTGC